MVAFANFFASPPDMNQRLYHCINIISNAVGRALTLKATLTPVIRAALKNWYCAQGSRAARMSLHDIMLSLVVKARFYGKQAMLLQHREETLNLRYGKNGLCALLKTPISSAA